MQGRVPKPDAIGDPDSNQRKYKRKNNFVQNPPRPPEVSSGDLEAPPELLSPDAIQEWYNLAPILQKCRLLTRVDRNALVALCNAWSEFMMYSRAMNDHHQEMRNSDTYKKHPAATLREAAFNRWYRMSLEFGMTPSSRTKVSVPEGSQGEESWEDKYFGDEARGVI